MKINEYQTRFNANLETYLPIYLGYSGEYSGIGNF
jgi:hypothetical protein